MNEDASALLVFICAVHVVSVRISSNLLNLVAHVNVYTSTSESESILMGLTLLP